MKYVCFENALSFRAERGISLCFGVDSRRKDRSKIPRSARNDKVVSWFLGAAGGMSDCFENKNLRYCNTEKFWLRPPGRAMG
jgi:hypothetical protein